MTRLRPATVLAASSLALGACTSGERVPAPPSPQAMLTPQQAMPMTPQAPARPGVSGPVLDAGGACTGPVPTTATAIAPGIGECELVRLKGRPPADVLVGEGRSGREVQVLYTEPGARELYFFVENRLDRIVR